MVALSKMGVMGLNAELQGCCQHCLWLEWNPQERTCRNAGTLVCPQQQGRVTADLEFTAIFLWEPQFGRL